jgi:isoleucyl-tRNA synthetase
MKFPEQEQKTLHYWEEHDIFKKTLEKQAPKGPFVFFEGPPTANGKPGIHHAEARAFKDCIPRFRTMQGYKVARKAGWDTHGLPVELEVEKQLGIKSKIEIEELGVDAFNEKCKESVWAYKQEWEDFTKRLGYWLDLDDAYITYKPEYIETLWWIVKQVWEKGLLYKDYRVTPHCPRCESSLSSHELSQGYQDVKDLSITANFKLVNPASKNLPEGTSLLAWTTTPWTLPGNVGLAVGEKLEYALVKRSEDGAHFVLASTLVETVLADTQHEVVSKIVGADLVGLEYEPLYPYMKDMVEGDEKVKLEENAYRVYAADFVNTEDGTGIVHTAVMYGIDDFVFGTEVGLPKFHLVSLDGTFIEGTDFLAGRFVRDEDLAVDVIKDLAKRGLLFAKFKYEHSYPFCWRCKTPVIYYAKDSWYIRMKDLREKLLEENKNIHWEPDHIQEGRFGEWLRDVKDWAFSRERYWGTPLPIWESEDGDRLCIGSFEELRSLAKDPSLVGEEFDPHRPYVDDVVLVKDGKEYTRVKDVCDVWFDSGSMPFAQHHYPFENKELVDSGDAYPADYISEAIDQTRGWFYTLLAVSTLLGKERSYKNVICLGHVLDSEGKKMSKSVGNIVKPMEMIDKYGADAVRWYMYTINQPGESKRFDEKTLSDMVKKNFNILSNVVSFYEMFAKDAGEAGERTHVLDQWMLARTHELVAKTTDRLERYVVTETVREIGNFITDLSTWYVRRIRDRVKSTDAADRDAAIGTLREVLETLSKLMAPFAPFLAEDVYKRSGGSLESVHLAEWPVADAGLIKQEILDEMGRTRSVVSKALERRAESGMNVRQVLGSMTVTVPSGEFASEYQQLVKEEVNVKAIEVAKGEYAVALDLTLTPELIREGTVREIIRRVNSNRKKAELSIEDKIHLYVAGPDEVVMAVGEHEDVLLHGTLSVDVRTNGDDPEVKDEFRVNEFDIVVGFDRM